MLTERGKFFSKNTKVHKEEIEISLSQSSANGEVCVIPDFFICITIHDFQCWYLKKKGSFTQRQLHKTAFIVEKL